MADKSFGVKQINLIGASGTPTIESPNNLNLNANTVAISTDVTVGGQVQSNLRIGSPYFVGIGTTTSSSKLDVIGNVRVSGASTLGITTTTVLFANSLNVSGVITSTGGFSGQLSGVSNYSYVSGFSTFSSTSGFSTVSTQAGISTSVIGGVGSLTQLQVTGISTFTNGPVFIGAASSTGTATQRLQVTGGAYVSGNVGIGSTLPNTGLVVRNTATTTSPAIVIDPSTNTRTAAISLLNTGNAMSVGVLNNSGATGYFGGSNFLNGPAYGGFIGVQGSLPLIIVTNNTEAVRVSAGGSVGIGTTNPTETLSVLGKIQIHQKVDSTSRLIFRGVPGTPYRWNIDNDSSNLFRIFSEDDATAANGAVRLSISTTGTVTAAKFSGDGSLLTGIVATGSGVVVQNQGSNVGTASTLNFSTNLTASFASGTATISLSNNPSISGILTADQVYTSNNGNGTNIRIGDDLWLGDINVANTTRLSGAQNGNQAFIVFGNSDAVALGRTGTGPLYYGGNFTSAGVITASSYNGSGSNLTDIVTSIVAGTNITVSGSTGQVTINATGGGSGQATYGGYQPVDLLEVMLFS